MNRAQRWHEQQPEVGTPDPALLLACPSLRPTLPRWTVLLAATALAASTLSPASPVTVAGRQPGVMTLAGAVSAPAVIASRRPLQRPASAREQPRAGRSRSPLARATHKAEAAAHAVPSAGGQGPDFRALAECESSGNPRARNGRYAGLYQFDVPTWQSVGGSGEPGAASPAEQTRRARLLYAARGRSPWPECGWLL